MLKWTVMARREAEKSNGSRRSVANPSTSEQIPKSSKRRHSSAHRRSSLGVDKENQFTSTPIKTYDDHFQFDALRDVSNLTPKDPTNRRVLSAKKHRRSASPTSHRKQKKKKLCLNLSHRQEFGKNYFKPFESVDSHIEEVLVDRVCGCNKEKEVNTETRTKRTIQDIYAPTLPTFSMEYSPCFMRNTHCVYNFSPAKATPLGKYLNHESLQPNKKLKIDHVNDFLNQINFISNEEEKMTEFAMESKSAKKSRDEVKVSPLVKKFVNLRFSKNNSSLINDLSLDQIVNAILNSSVESVDKVTTDSKENASNETQEDNLINAKSEAHCKNSSSPDSGFKSSTTENSHRLDANFQCKCTKTSTPNMGAVYDKTIININETFNERCVDDSNPRKRSSSTVLVPDNNAKKILLDKSEDDVNFTLKRQRCIRRRRTDDEKKVNSPKTHPTAQKLDQINDDDSFESLNIANDNRSTPLKDASTNDTFTMLTPVENNRRFRRCLLFESPTSLSETASTTNNSTKESRGYMDLNVHVEHEELCVNVIRCKNLYRPNGKQINAYVKVALNDGIGDNRRKRNGLLQRTAVQADSSKPFFNHTFKFPLSKETLQKRLQIEVWHRDRTTRTSEFLGCTSFDVRDAYKKDISGSYRLLPQRCQNIPITVDHKAEACEELDLEEMCESHSSAEEIMSLDELDNDLKKATSKAILSEQQKYADENLFLRYLELDPTEGPEAIPAAMQRKATGNKNGRTPFTHTKRLTRAPKSGFGFSVVWTHPPRIERVEKGLPADRAGILPGDYIIFVDKHNVVMMPEIDILNLIRSYGSQLTLEIFRRNASKNGSVPSVRRLNSTGTCSTTGLPITGNPVQRRPSTVCSTNTASVDYNRKKLHLPQVTFSAERPSNNQDENRKKTMYQLISKEQQYATGLQFAVTRFVSALAERPDLITPTEHKILFQNCEEILRITEDILDNMLNEDGDININNVGRTYHMKLSEITTAYRRYCSGIKKADCVLANKTKSCNSEFVRFLQTPSIPRRRPDITAFIHKPLEHYREVLKAFTVIQSQTKLQHEDCTVINQIVHDLQHTYKEMTVEAGLMEPVGEGRPLLSVQDLENRLVFTKCKPFVLNKPGRQWIFGGDLGRVEGRNVRQYWTLLFSDLLLFAKVSRDRVLFIIEDPLPLDHITDMFFNIRKKDTEFRITVAPAGRLASSPTVHCGPDLTRTPKKNASKRTVVLRAPTAEMKAVWQNLLQRQIFHVNAGMDGSSFSSPLESPDAPITSSVATLQSAESLSFRRQTPQNINENSEMQKQIDALIEHKCKQLRKNNSGKGNAIHLEKWMKGQLDADAVEETELEQLSEDWTEEMLRKRSEELKLIDAQGNVTCHNEIRRNDSSDDIINLSDHDQSPSKSTTTESQVTVRSSPLVPESVPVCRQCHKNCLPSVNNSVKSNSSARIECSNDENDNKEENNDWQPLLLMGLSALNPAATLVKLDPFSAPIPQINVAPPTPENYTKTNTDDSKAKENPCNCRRPEINNFEFSNEVDISPDDSPQTEEHPYHSLSSSNLTLRRFGTVSSLERLGTDEHEESWDERYSSDDEPNEGGIDNEAFYHSSIRNWTAKAGSFVAEKMAFFERLGEDYRSTGKFFERYLHTTDTTVNGDDAQEDETSGATSGEEIWGTPTSGGELDDPLSSPNYEGKQSPYDGSISSDNGDDTELMMDELLMTPPISGAMIRGLLPRRTLEPLIEEDFSESCSPTSSESPTEPSMSPEQDNGIGDVADTCSTAVASPKTPDGGNSDGKVVTLERSVTPMMHRSESYRRIVEAAEEEMDDNVSFFDRFKPTVKFINIERVPRARSVKIFEFFNVRRERRIHQTVPENSQLIKFFSKESVISDSVPTAYSEKPLSPRLLKDKQMDRRFWKQLSRRRGTKPSNLPA